VENGIQVQFSFGDHENLVLKALRAWTVDYSIKLFRTLEFSGTILITRFSWLF